MGIKLEFTVHSAHQGHLAADTELMELKVRHDAHVFKHESRISVTVSRFLKNGS